jgi:hypothetical protein
MGERLFTDKLVFRWLEVFDVWSLDSATPATLTYPAHASGLSEGSPSDKSPPLSSAIFLGLISTRPLAITSRFEYRLCVLDGVLSGRYKYKVQRWR